MKYKLFDSKEKREETAIFKKINKLDPVKDKNKIKKLEKELDDNRKARKEKKLKNNPTLGAKK